MFGDNLPVSQSDNSNGSSILKSGYDSKSITGTQKLRGDFKQALELNPTSATESQIKSQAALHGKFKGQAEMVKRLSEQKIATAEAAHEVYSVVMQHANQAASSELKWQRTTKKALQELSPKLLDMDIEQEQHRGFAFYCDTADKHLNF